MDTQRLAESTNGNLAKNQQGITMLTVMMFLIILTVIGIGSLTISGLENRIAGFSRTAEAASAASESCVGTAVNVIQQTLYTGTLPAAFSPTPVTVANAGAAGYGLLQQEIMGQRDNDADTTATASADTSVPINGYTVNGDIDRLYVAPIPGASLEFGAAYDKGGGGSVYVYYRIDCVASQVATGATNRITAIYACVITGESCQKQI
jgi:Tfp pilus assembly protein PilX